MKQVNRVMRTPFLWDMALHHWIISFQHSERTNKSWSPLSGIMDQPAAQCALNPTVSTTKPSEKLSWVFFLSYVQKTYHHLAGYWRGKTPDILVCHPGRYATFSVLQRTAWYRRPQVYTASPSCVARYKMDKPAVQSEQVERPPLAQPARTTRQGCGSRAQIWPSPSHPTPGHQNPLHQTQLHGQDHLGGNWVEATSQ